MLFSSGLFANTIVIRGVEFEFLPFAFALFVCAAIAVPMVLFRKWFFYRRRLKKQTITAEYIPPLGFNPAEISYMFNGKLGEREVGATIVHLVQRGFLHVKLDSGKKLIYSGPRVDENLKVYEKKLIEEAEIHDGATIEQMLSRFISYKKDNIHIKLTSRQLAFTQRVHSDLYRRQLVIDSSKLKFISGVLMITMMNIVVLIFAPLIIVWGHNVIVGGAVDFVTLGSYLKLSMYLSLIFFFPLIIISTFLQFMRGHVLGRKWIVASKLERMWPQMIGFREYVKLVEKEKLIFETNRLHESTKKDILPYAIALGFVKNWRQIVS